MIYSYTQLARYLLCPRQYRYQYVDGWQSQELRASLVFGRAFEQALSAGFQCRNADETFHQEWSRCREMNVRYSRGGHWQKMFEQGITLLKLFREQDRVRIQRPKRNLQIRVSKPLSATSAFVGYVDAFGFLDGTRALIDFKTATASYPETPDGLLALDPQLLCYSWLTGEPEVAFVIFVRSSRPHIQYLRATVSQKQRHEFNGLVVDTVAQIEAGLFPPHPGIRFPQPVCTGCSYLGLCLERPELTEGKIVRNGGRELAWLDELQD